MANASLKAPLVAMWLTILSLGCATPQPVHYWHGSDASSATELDELLAHHPLAPTQNIHVLNLGQTPAVSHHLVQVRHAEPLHIHRVHDLTVIIHRGHGEMRVGGEIIPVGRGDVLFIPRGVPHAFTNRASQPAAAVVAFSPAFDPADTVPVIPTK